ncbi:MAG: hypothetical protein Q7S46_13475 [Gallionella sp.]|nr:hypothetical protein [Gallionella sp.]
MRKPDIVILMVSGLFYASSWAAVAENPQTPPAIQGSKKTMKPATGDSKPTRLKTRKQPDQPRNTAPKSSRTPSKPLLPKLDEKNLGLGCAQP